MWEVEQQYFDDYKKRFNIRIWDKIGILFTRLGTYAQSKTQIPYKVRERAYNASGRLADDPTALDQFKK